MAATLTVGIWNTSKFQSVKIDNINLESNVEILKNEVSNKFDKQKSTIDLIYCGLVLEDDKPLSRYGVANGSTIHIVERVTPLETPQKRTITEMDIQHLADAFSAFKASSRSRAVIMNLSRPETLDSIIAANPGLEHDPVAVTIIQHPDLFIQMSDMGIVRQIIEEHPILIDVVHYIITNVQEVSLNTNQPSTSSGYSYSLDALSDDEDMDSANSDSNRESHPLSRNGSYNAITAAQLAAAISSATNSSFNSSDLPTTPTSSGNVITSEMFSNAIQQAFATSPFGGSSPLPGPPASSRNEGESMDAIIRRLQPQLDQMREMGLTNVQVNIRALQATSGDVQTAINLVFNGVID